MLMASVSLLIHRPPSYFFNDYFGLVRKKNTSSNETSFTFSPAQKSRTSLGCKCQLQLTELADSASAAYGALLLGGGIFAFRKSGSKGSLYGGLTGGALMAMTYFLMQTQETKAFGDALGFGAAFLFSSVFGIRLAASRKLTPSGPLLGVSICASAVFLLAYLQDSSSI